MNHHVVKRSPLRPLQDCTATAKASTVLGVNLWLDADIVVWHRLVLVDSTLKAPD